MLYVSIEKVGSVEEDEEEAPIDSCGEVHVLDDVPVLEDEAEQVVVEAGIY